jgi:hypothetical protein
MSERSECASDRTPSQRRIRTSDIKELGGALVCACDCVHISRACMESVLRAIRGASSVKKTGKNTEAEERGGGEIRPGLTALYSP